MDIAFLPVTAERLPDLETVIGNCSYGRKCWCAYWYLPNAEFKRGWGEGNAAHLKGLVLAGREPGLIAYDGALPVAWVSVAPRSAFDRLNRSKNFAPIDGLSVWSVNCFIVAPDHRRRGMMAQLAGAAAEFAFGKGAPAVEGYPIEPGPRTGANDLYLGTIAAFEAAGYEVVAAPLPRRRIMRKFAP
jgi:hypothetical protein